MNKQDGPARMFTGFWEARTGEEREVATSIKYLTTDQLLERLRDRMNSAEPGTHIRIDVVAWGEE
jgi:hypothetical protein